MKVISWVLAILLIVLCYQLLVSEGGIKRVQQLEHTLRVEEATNDALKARNAGLQAEVNDLRRGNHALEERARSELGMIKDDEAYYQFIKQRKATQR